MQQSLNLTSLIHSTQNFFKKLLKFHYIISIILIMAGVAFTSYYINDILSNSAATETDLRKSTFTKEFDTATIEKVNKFKYSNEATRTNPPAGRINPFNEAQ